MNTEQASMTRYKHQYQSYPHSIDSIELDIWLHPTVTRVINKMKITPCKSGNRRLFLDGNVAKLCAISIDGKPYCEFVETEQGIQLSTPEIPFVLTIENEICPQSNTELEGLFLKNGIYCTQCEAEGFQKITYFPDRPDVLAIYTVTLHADKATCPVLLSNGNIIGCGNGPNNSHWVRWQDPFVKACYLFAIVAGQLEYIEDSYTTQSGRTIPLRLFTEVGFSHQGRYGLNALKKAMFWDEEVFGLGYDLDAYHIVATDFFNVEAMENRGLNIFNSEYVLADPEFSTDEDYYQIESVIAHEYFHNWTGNRIICRDWFQLTLKEGLTVYRDQCFSADSFSPVVARLRAVKKMHEEQFLEDKSPFSHAPRPEKVEAMDNFYTSTVYEKGAEIVRMFHSLLGEQTFNTGLRGFLQQYDGKNVTCEEFIGSLQAHCEVNLAPMLSWYDSKGTPHIQCNTSYEPHHKTLTLDCRQFVSKDSLLTPLAPKVMPLRVEVISENKSSCYLSTISKTQQSFTFNNVEPNASLAVLCDFSAPVTCDLPLSDEQRSCIMRFAEDPIIRWTTQQQWIIELIATFDKSSIESNELENRINLYCQTIENLCRNEDDKALLSALLTFPSDMLITSQLSPKVGIESVWKGKSYLYKQIGERCHSALLWRWQNIKQSLSTEQNVAATHCRELYNSLLVFLLPKFASKIVSKLLLSSLHSNCMTLQVGMLNALAHIKHTSFSSTMLLLEIRWQSIPQAMIKWFRLQALNRATDSVERIEKLLQHSCFDIANPNHVKALVGTFVYYNTTGFHRADGAGYDLLNNILLLIDIDNPQLAAWLFGPFMQWQWLDNLRQVEIQKRLVILASQPQLSRELGEKVRLAMSSS